MPQPIPHAHPSGYTTQRADGVHVYSCAVEGCGFQIENPVKAGVVEAARWHRDAHKAAWAEIEPQLLAQLAGGPVCPECAQGKHQNCDGQTYDDETDDVVLCGCPDTDEVQH